MEVTAEEVLKRVREAGGHLKVDGLDPNSAGAWRHAAKIAQLRLLRAGPQRLRSWSTPGAISLTLVRLDRHGNDVPENQIDDAPVRKWVPPPRPRPRTQEFLGRVVPVPSSLKNPHRIVDELTEAIDHPERSIYGPRAKYMPRQQRPLQRMRRIWQAIVTEAAYRGYDTAFHHNRRDTYDRGQLVVRIDWDEFPLDLYGERGKPLRLTIKGVHPERRRGYDTWADTPERPLEKQLGEIFTHIEQRADILLARKEQEQRREAERRKERDRLEREAHRRFTEDHRRTVIAARIGDRQLSDQARAYSAALQAVADDLDDGRAGDVRAWAGWILTHADRIDPRINPAGMPAAPKPTRDDLRPYLPAGHWY